MSLAGMIDPTKYGKYPVILSDALLGKKSKEVYTGVRYNHKPDPTPSLAKLKPTSKSSSTYDLSYNDGGLHKYQGIRASEDGQYVLIFDPSREAFVLHKVDSTFNMNLIRTPSNKDAESLRQEHPYLANSTAEPTSSKPGKAKENKPKKQQEEEKGMLTMPTEQPKKLPQPKKPSPPSDVDEDSEDDDDVLVMEFPGGETGNRDFSPAFPPRRFSEFVQHPDEDEDADGEPDDDDDDMEHFKLPSPINHQMAQQSAQPMQLEPESEEDEEQEEQEPELDVDDLEAELEAELEEANNNGNQSESDVSEED